MGGWHEIDHTADLALHVWGDDLAELFVSAARGMCSLMAEPAPVGDATRLRIVLSAPNVEALLVDWLNELLYQCESAACVCTEFCVEGISPTELRAAVVGSPIDVRTSHIKAATYHLLAVEATETGYETQIVFDV